MNKIQIIGNIVRDATITDVNGRKAINFNVAVNENYKDKNGTKVEKAVFYSCVLWRDALATTEVSKYLTKGVKVYVEGSPSAELYKTKDNQTAIDFKINVNPFKGLELLSAVKKEDAPEVKETSETGENASPGMVPNHEFANAMQNDDQPF